MAELRAGRKRSHWIWYVFPQLRGLGASETSRHFGLDGRAEAEAYLRDPTLRSRLVEAVAVVRDRIAGPRAPALDDLLGGRTDALKLVSSLTLFAAVAQDLQTLAGDEAWARLARDANAVLEIAAGQGYPRCAFTMQRLEEA